MSKLTNQAIVDRFKEPGVNYPPVVVEQTNFRISDIIRKNQTANFLLLKLAARLDFYELYPKFGT